MRQANIQGREIEHKVIAALRNTLALDESVALDRGTSLLGSMPELDSLSLVALITTLEREFGFSIEDDEIDAEAFASVGTLLDFVTAKLT